MAWSSEQLSALFSTFGEDVESNNITLSSVREKMKVMKHSVLSSLDERKIYDRLRSEVRRQCNDSQLDSLPVDADAAYDRVARMLKPQAELSDVTDSDSVVAPTTRQSVKDVFTKQDLERLMKNCSHIAIGGAITDDRISGALNKSAAGRQLLDAFSVSQLKNRLKYERRQLSTRVACSSRLAT